MHHQLKRDIGRLVTNKSPIKTVTVFLLAAGLTVQTIKGCNFSRNEFNFHLDESHYFQSLMICSRIPDKESRDDERTGTNPKRAPAHADVNHLRSA